MKIQGPYKPIIPTCDYCKEKVNKVVKMENPDNLSLDYPFRNSIETPKYCKDCLRAALNLIEGNND